MCNDGVDAWPKAGPGSNPLYSLRGPVYHRRPCSGGGRSERAR